ncbi:MAG: PRC-barrel domain-containing protein [Bauldia litoralis]
MFLNRQDTDEDLASNWIGQSIYNRADENLGDVNDLLFTDTGSVGAVIVGVGGFLGIGEKNVAVPFEALESRTDENGGVTLYINATAEQLDAAPEFLTLAEIQAEERARAAQAEMEPAPAPAL